MLLLTEADVKAVFDLPEAIASQREAFAALGEGQAVLAPRLLLPGQDSVAFCYAARVTPSAGAVCKFGSVNPGNTEAPSVSATIIVLDPADGRPAAIIDGTSVTTSRTSAASAVAVDHLANPGPCELAVLGCGTQGMAHVRAIALVRPLLRVRVYSRHIAASSVAADILAAELGLPVEAVSSARDAVDGAGIVAACTTSSEPVVKGAWLSPGCTVVSVGSFTPYRSEVDAAVISRAATVVVDDVDTAREQAGPVVSALSEGRMSVGDLVPLGKIVAGHAPGRGSDQDVVFYNSVGLGIQDAAAARRIVALASAAGRGGSVSL